MRILASADVHGIWPVNDWLLTVARKQQVDGIVLAGDLLGCPEGFETAEEAQQHEARLLEELLKEAGVSVPGENRQTGLPSREPPICPAVRDE